ncbi:MAG: type I-E CRISPR-associated protein Cse1/CasA, partial [Elusimicrobiota bacterium]
MNLIDDKWIPVRRKNGEKIKIAPWQITEGIGTDNKITELAAPRPDFNGALIQFLIGLLQTTCTPENPGEWRKWLNEPPTPDELKKRFETVKYAFNLDGDGPRFMQEVGLIKEKKQNNKTIDEMIIDMPGEQTLKLNKDHFIKRNTIGQLCPHCSTMALFTLQINAPSGGQGHLTGLRGGGPLSTLVYGNKIWETAWLNILEKSKFENLANFEKNDDENKFPWLTNNRNSEKGLMTTPEDIHPAQLYWATPRRIFIKFENSEHQTVCDLCDRVTEQVVKQYCTKPRGINYEGTWRH